MPRVFNTTVDIGAYELFTQAGPIVVSTTNDELDSNVSDGDLSLREAIALANGIPGANTITFAVSINGEALILLLGQIPIIDTVTITGNGTANTMIDAQWASRIFDITGGDISLENLTLQKGKTAAVGERGGAKHAKQIKRDRDSFHGR